MTADKPNPRIVAVYGFLGSGKTTVMLWLAKKAVEKGRRAAIVVNEAGQIPVDGEMLDVGGLPVKEIFGGCICCAAAGDFTETLGTLLANRELDYILIEPSGMAQAPGLFSSIEKHVSNDLTRLLILDGVRLGLLIKAARPLIAGQILVADTILLNKADLMGMADVNQAKAIISSIRENVEIYPSAAKDGIGQQLLESLVQ